MRTRTLCLLSLAILSACTRWPEHGHGGMAEHDLASINPLQHEGNSLIDVHLRQEFDLSMRHLDVLVLEGAQACFPAAVRTAKILQARIARELQGGMEADAEIDLYRQRQQLALLERRLDRIDPTYCSLLGTTQVSTDRDADLDAAEAADAGADIRARLSSLLGGDNMFAFDSEQVNPLFRARLTEAATILREHDGIRLVIDGHSDEKGDDSYNAELSRRRAANVAAELVALGVDASRIDITQSGESIPLFVGDAPHIRIVNRRVDIRLQDSE